MICNNKNLLVGGQQTLHKYKNIQHDCLHIKTLMGIRQIFWCQ